MVWPGSEVERCPGPSNIRKGGGGAKEVMLLAAPGERCLGERRGLQELWPQGEDCNACTSHTWRRGSGESNVDPFLLSPSNFYSCLSLAEPNQRPESLGKPAQGTEEGKEGQAVGLEKAPE